MPNLETAVGHEPTTPAGGESSTDYTKIFDEAQQPDAREATPADIARDEVRAYAAAPDMDKALKAEARLATAQSIIDDREVRGPTEAFLANPARMEKLQGQSDEHRQKADEAAEAAGAAHDRGEQPAKKHFWSGLFKG